jgi:hypothetical protein
MIGARSGRWSIAFGILMVVLLVASSVVTGRGPAEGASITTIMSFYAAHASAQMLSGYLTLLAVMVFLIFISGLRARLQGEETGAAAAVGYAAGIAFVPLTVIGYGVDIVLAASATTTSSQAFEAMRGVEGAIIGISDLPLAACLFAFAIAIIATGALPRWLGWFGLLPAAALLAGSFAPFAPPLGGIGFLGFLLFLVWTLTTGIVALTRGAAAAQRAETAAPATPALR